jgi:hypothetical protein
MNTHVHVHTTAKITSWTNSMIKGRVKMRDEKTKLDTITHTKSHTIYQALQSSTTLFIKASKYSGYYT